MEPGLPPAATESRGVGVDPLRSLNAACSEAEVRLALDVARIGVWSWNLIEDEGTWTSQVETLFGLDRGACGGSLTSFLPYIHREDRDAVRDAFTRARRGEADLDLTFRVHRVKSGEGGDRWMAVRAEVVRDESGEPIRLVGSCQDVTAIRQAEERAQAASAEVTHTLETITSAFVALDREWRYSYVNQTAGRLLRQPPGEMIGRTIWELFPGLEQTRFEPALRRAMSDRAMVVVEEYYHSLSTWYECRIHPTDTGISIFFDDVTARKQAEEELKRSEARLRLATAAGRVGTWEWELPSNRIIWSESQYDILGLEPLAGNPSYEDWRRCVHPEDLAGVEEAIRLARDEGRDYHSEYRVTWPDGSEHWVEGRGQFVRDEQGRPIRMIGVLADIHERKMLEEALRVRASELVESDRKKDEFLAVLAHELRNPLAAISNAVQVVKRGGETSNLQPWAWEITERQVANLSRLVDDLLDVSRITRGKLTLKKESVDFRAVLDRAVEAVRSLIDTREHELTLHLGPGPLRLLADPTRLEQIFVNLLANAAKYTERRGKIVLSAEREQEHLVIRVKDSGIGLTPDLIPRIFDMFAQADQHRSQRGPSGLGIGLTLVRRLVELHKGEVSAYSEGLGLGSEFLVRLPAPLVHGVTTTTAIRGGAAPLPVQEIDRPRVLVVDDNIDSAQSMAMLLSTEGYEVQVAFNGADALETAQRFLPQAVLLDICLPGLSGYDVASRLRRIHGLTEVLLIGVSGYVQDQRLSREAGFHHHLVKPVRNLDLLPLLKAVVKSPPLA